MTSIELASSIYKRQQTAGKRTYLTIKQSIFLVNLLKEENNYANNTNKHVIATVLPGGVWVKSLSKSEEKIIGKANLKTAYLITKPIYFMNDVKPSNEIMVM